jgi:hypothetical protein
VNLAYILFLPKDFRKERGGKIACASPSFTENENFALTKQNTSMHK